MFSAPDESSMSVNPEERVGEYPDEQQVQDVSKFGFPRRAVLSVAKGFLCRTGRPYATSIELLQDVQKLQTLDELMGGGHSTLFLQETRRTLVTQPGLQFFNISE